MHCNAAAVGSITVIGGGGALIETVRVAVGSLSRTRGRNSAAYLQTKARFASRRRSYRIPRPENFRSEDLPRMMWLESLEYSRKAE